MMQNSAKPPFKRGDIVRCKTRGHFDFDFDSPHVVLYCIYDSSFPSGFRVDLDNGEIRWDSSWFELDKNQIIYNIISEL